MGRVSNSIIKCSLVVFELSYISRDNKSRDYLFRPVHCLVQNGTRLKIGLDPGEFTSIFDHLAGFIRSSVWSRSEPDDREPNC